MMELEAPPTCGVYYESTYLFQARASLRPHIYRRTDKRQRSRIVSNILHNGGTHIMNVFLVGVDSSPTSIQYGLSLSP